MPRRRILPTARDGTKLPEMVGAVIYVRVSTKEQTENLSLATQLRACEEYCHRQGYEIRERFHEEGESAKTTDLQSASGAAEVLPNAHGEGSLRGRVQPDTIRPGEIRPFRPARPLEVSRHLAAVSHRADRRHVHRQTDGGRAGRVRAVRQRRALGPHARGYARRTGTRTMDIPGAARIPERSEVVGQEPRSRSRARGAGEASVRGLGDRSVYEAGSDRTCSRGRVTKPQGLDVVATAEGCTLVAHSALDHLGGIDIVVNVLGGSEAPAGGFAALDDEAWRKEIDLDLMPAVRLAAISINRSPQVPISNVPWIRFATT